MRNEKKTKRQLIQELELLRRRLDALEKPGTQNKGPEENSEADGDQFRKLIEQSPLVYELYDKEGTQRMVNRAYSALWDIDPTLTVGSYNLWKSHQGEILHPYLIRVYSGESLVGPELYWDPRKEIGEGRERWVSTIMYPLENHQGEVEHIVLLHEDITDRKDAENALRHSEEKLSKAFQASPDWITISTWDEGRYVDVNDAFLRISGYTRQEVLGRTSMEINLWDEPNDRETALEIIREKGNLKDFEVKFKMKSGRVGLILWSAEVIELDGGKFILSVCKDITECRQVEEDLKESEERFRLVVENAPDAITIHIQGRFVYVNQAAVGMLGGLSPDQFLGQPVMDRIHPDYHPVVRERIRLIREENKIVPPLEEKYLKLDGTSIDVEVSAAPFRFKNQIGGLVFLHDITERKQAERELQKAKENLEMRVEERTTILHEVIWKLRTELVERKRVEEALRKSQDALRGLSNQLIFAQEKERKRISIELHDDLGQSIVGLKFQLCHLPKKLNADQEELRATIEQAVTHLDQMTEKVRRLSRDLRPAVLEHLELFEALQWLFEDSSKNYGLRIVNNCRKTRYAFSKEQEVHIFRIFQEALTNIGKHAQATQVVIAMIEQENELVFSIKDDGRGFAPEEIKHRPPIEIGLGLTAMSERSRFIGGVLDIRSVFGEGTTVTFTVSVEKKPKKSKPTLPQNGKD